LTADLYVSLGDAAEVDDALLDAIAGLPGVTGTSLARVARLPTDVGEVGVRAARPGPEGWGLDLVDGEPGALARLEAEPVVALAEPFAFRHGLRPGDRLSLPTAEGERTFPVVAVYRDYDA